MEPGPGFRPGSSQKITARKKEKRTLDKRRFWQITARLDRARIQKRGYRDDREEKAKGPLQVIELRIFGISTLRTKDLRHLIGRQAEFSRYLPVGP